MVCLPADKPQGSHGTFEARTRAGGMVKGGERRDRKRGKMRVKREREYKEEKEEIEGKLREQNWEASNKGEVGAEWARR